MKEISVHDRFGSLETPFPIKTTATLDIITICQQEHF